jgi:uncharacterized delta-60 repeat protein
MKNRPMFAVVFGAGLLCAMCSVACAEDGVVVTDINGYSDVAYGGSVMSDGRVISLGRAASPGTSFDAMAMAATRHLPNGNLDTTFGGGIVVVPRNRDWDDYFTRGTLQSDDKVLLVGRRYLRMPVTGYSKSTSWVIARYTVNGVLDRTFNKSGIQTTVIDAKNASEAPCGVVVQLDGKIVVCGNYERYLGAPSRPALIRYNSNGSLDATFGGTGIVKPTISVVSHYSIGAVAMNGTKILMVGSGRNASWTEVGILLVQLNANGAFDSTFGTGGVVYSVWPDVERWGSRVFVEADGSIVVGANAAPYGPGELTWGSVVRYTSTGACTEVLDLPAGGGFVVAKLGDNLVLGQDVLSEDQTKRGYAVSQLTPDGTLDPSFGVDGVAVTWLDMTVHSVAVGPRGEICGFGSKLLETDDFAAFKLLSNGELDLDF